MLYDVIVVGAGPAGSTTARECAVNGLSVLMLDKAEFPRDKPCGGGVTIRAVNLLPFEITPVVERVIHGIRITVNRSKEFTRLSASSLAYLTQRSRFDQFLLERALEAGASLKERISLRSVERYSSHVVVRTESEVYEGRTLVAADGANGTTSRLAGIQTRIVSGIALEGNITPVGAFPREWEHSLGMDIGAPDGGYGWLFPKGDHLNIGLGGWKSVGPQLRGDLEKLVRFYGYAPDSLWGLRGHHLPVRMPDSPLYDGNVLMVGDAAGLIDPLTAEGIHSAIWSGKSAAKHITAYAADETEDLSAYAEDVSSGLLPSLGASRRFHDIFHLTPEIYMSVDRRTSLLWNTARKILTGEQTYNGLMERHPAFATIIDFISDLIRVSPFLQKVAGLQYPAPPQRFFVKKQASSDESASGIEPSLDYLDSSTTGRNREPVHK